MVTCERCGQPQDDHWPGEAGELCQECWEAACSEAWWEALQGLPQQDDEVQP